MAWWWDLLEILTLKERKQCLYIQKCYTDVVEITTDILHPCFTYKNMKFHRKQFNVSAILKLIKACLLFPISKSMSVSEFHYAKSSCSSANIRQAGAHTRLYFGRSCIRIAISCCFMRVLEQKWSNECEPSQLRIQRQQINLFTGVLVSSSTGDMRIKVGFIWQPLKTPLKRC